ncbi:MAG: nucleotide exchange factor GrpE [Bdellovibrionota bacterium]|nr:MAG: nucleotide exchange factor GrpE [Pseudomonadota bacterium]
MTIDPQNEDYPSFEEGLGNSNGKEQETDSLKIQRLEEQLLDAKDRFLRQAADMENMRRRQEKDRADLLKFGTEKLLSELLPVLDSLDKALQAAEGQQNPVTEGVKMVQKQFTGVLDNHGLKPIAAKGASFDPNLHQAISRLEEDVTEDTVKEEYQKGYTLNGRLVRPAMVSVSVPKSS